MSAIAPDPAIRVRPLVESRPPGRGWHPPEAVLLITSQPRLDLMGPAAVDVAAPSGRDIARTVVQATWTVRPRRDLPDAGEWGAVLALAVVQTLLAQRPIAQLNRWLADDVLSLVSMQQRRRQTGQAVRSVAVRSVRVQHPAAEVAEACAHVVVDVRHSAPSPSSIDGCPTTC